MQKSATLFVPIYFAAFFFTLQTSLPLYINSSFLGQFLPEKSIGLIFAASSILIIFFLVVFPTILQKIGNYKTIIWILVLEIGLLIALAVSSVPFIVIPIFILIQICIALVSFTFDIFLEQFSKDKTTGATRGTFLTVVNAAILLGPLIAGFILSDNDFWKIYLIAAFALVPAIYVITQTLKDFKDHQYNKIPYIKILISTVLSRHPKDEVRHALIASLLLWFFYAWMVIYTPLYLHAHIGFTWAEIGVIFTIMLIPFLLFELPMGKLADRVGEKKIMLAGFFIMSFFTATLFFIREPSIILWAAFLFCTRIGASFVEITSESYFFKHIESADANILSVFRNSAPFAYIVGPIIASLLLIFMDIQFLFLVLAAILLFGIWNAWKMRAF
ncbi:MAG: MFS transporter [bacterium]|nr:MFS transporter [bacterium]